ncbi:MAG: hypothetical protein V1789_05305 [PVC group bacterium]
MPRVNKFSSYKVAHPSYDPCRFIRQVNEFTGCPELSPLPDKPAGAVNICVLPE